MPSTRKSSKTNEEILKRAMRQYCNAQADLHDLQQYQKAAIKPELDVCKQLKTQLHDYMKEHDVQCLLDSHTKQFVYRQSRKTPRALTVELEEIIVDEIQKAETAGQLSPSTDLAELVQDVVRMVQEVRSMTVESLKIASKQPPSIKISLTPTVPEVQKLLSTYLLKTQECNDKAGQIKEAKSSIQATLAEATPHVYNYCVQKGAVKKPVNFKRNWSSAFSSCITKLNPNYFSKARPATTPAFLQMKQSKPRVRQVKALRPSKKRMLEVLTNLSQQKKSWTATSLTKNLFQLLRQEAEQNLVAKFESAEKDPVFKLSLNLNKESDDSDSN